MRREAFTTSNLLIVYLILGILAGLMGMLLWPYSINTWLEWAGKDPCIVWWQGMLLGLVPGLGQLSLPAAVVTWVADLFVS